MGIGRNAEEQHEEILSEIGAETLVPVVDCRTVD
jgi:hypothetical protein